MPNISLLTNVVTVNGHRCEGFAKVADALSLPEIQVANHEVGPDGLKVVSSTGMRGGPVVYKFQANSRSRGQFGTWFSQILKGARMTFEGSISDSQTGETTRLERGHMETGPAGTTLGDGIPAAREFTIVYETVLPNYDAFVSDASPVVST